MGALGKFGGPVQSIGLNQPQPTAIGTFATTGNGLPQGYVPPRPGRRVGIGQTPALQGLFRAGARTVGISEINAIATNVRRGA